MAAIPLTPPVKSAISRLFEGSDRDLVEDILINDCESLFADWTAAQLERVRAAILRWSDGSLDRFDAAVREANEDWRDVLVAAGFAEDLNLHKRWLAGKSVPPLPVVDAQQVEAEVRELLDWLGETKA